MNFAKFLRIPSFTEHLWWLLLYLETSSIIWYSIFFSTVFPSPWSPEMKKSSVSVFFKQILPGVKVWGYPTLLVSWFINFNKIAAGRPATLLKKILWSRYFPVNCRKFKRTPFLQNTQTQPSRGVLLGKRSKNMQQIHRRAPMPKCDFNKVAKQLYWNCTSAWAFSCKFAAYF